MEIQEKISLLRDKMAESGVDAFIVYSADPHLSEYLPTEWQERKWITGFTGSAGFAVFTRDKAALWTDGRYFVQAKTELAGSGIELMKDGVSGTPDYRDWILSEIPAGGTVAVNALATSHASWKALEDKFNNKNIGLKNLPLLKDIWTGRNPGEEIKPVFIHPEDRAGQSVSAKISAIRKRMAERDATAHIIGSLDDVAWTLNLRGSDVEANPVFLGYILLTEYSAKLFVDLEKISEDVSRHLSESSVQISDYQDFFNEIERLEGERILISPNSNQSIFESIKNKNEIIEAPAPGNLLKAIKNETELEGFRKVMVRDGVAMVKFLYWLTHNAGKEAMTEHSIGEKLREMRAEGENFVGESFSSIIGYQGNGAIVHYSAPENGSAEVEAEGSILIDSGGQYLEGTTDITRTMALGEVSEEFKRDSTLVLKGMIRLSMVKFPKGTRGTHLDAIARLPLWMDAKDYAHGTGHGIGSFLNVHEGPQNIRKDLNPQELLPGMVCSNEPGFYAEGKYGIRHENLIAVREWQNSESGDFYEFETLTICPFFKDIIVKELLAEEELNWLNDYHRWCGEKLLPLLSGEVKEWFVELIKPL